MYWVMSAIPDNDDGPVGRRLPSVRGSALSGQRVHVPEDLTGTPVVLLVAYERTAEDDLQHWLEFLNFAAPGLRVYTVPTVPPPAYGLLPGAIDDGSRGGIPRVLWPYVVTVYDPNGSPLREFLGEGDVDCSLVVLLDRGGVVRWFDAQGFTVVRGAELLDTLGALEEA